MALDSPIVAILPQDSGQLLVSRITGHVESQIGTCPVSALSGTSGHDSRTCKILESSREYLRLDEGDSVEPYIVVIVVVATLLVLGWFGSRRAIRREKAIAASRASDTLETFVGSFRPEVRPVASALYAELQNYTSTGHFPFRKSDNVAQMLGIDAIDVDEGLAQVAKQFACRQPSEEDDSKFRGRGTLEEYIEFIHHLKPT
jgi:hypothetical protein